MSLCGHGPCCGLAGGAMCYGVQVPQDASRHQYICRAEPGRWSKLPAVARTPRSHREGQSERAVAIQRANGRRDPCGGTRSWLLRTRHFGVLFRDRVGLRDGGSSDFRPERALYVGCRRDRRDEGASGAQNELRVRSSNIAGISGRV